ncbi:MAG: hypothetical protein ACK45I_11430 [Bacteroidota bacterium]|jgi:hypothetical protein
MTVQKQKSSFTLFGKQAVLLVMLVFTYVHSAHAQQAKTARIALGFKTDEYIQLTADTAKLAKALRRTLADGTVIYNVSIISQSGNHYLVGQGIKMYHKKIIAVEIEYDIANRTFYAVDHVPHYTCSAAACEDCELFLESGKIIGCHCPEMQTVSNQCTYKHTDISTFFSHLSQFIRVRN